MEVQGLRASPWRQTIAAAAISVVTMPLTAIWFLALGGVLIAGSAARVAISGPGRLGSAAYVGLGLLTGPAIYLALAAIQ